MLRAFLTTSLLVVFIMSAPTSDAEQRKAELMAAGMSAQAIDGAFNVMKNFEEAHRNDGQDKLLFNIFGLLGEIDGFMKTQSPQDQAIYQEVVLKKKAGN